VWDPRELALAARRGLEAASARTVVEQAVHGVDALAEIQLHPLLAEAFAAAGYGVVREAPYPANSSPTLKRRDRERCDLVLTPSPDAVLIDPVIELRADAARAGTLFAGAASPPPSPGRVSPADAFWIEIKLVGQYTHTLGVPGPNRAYGGELTMSVARDLAKLGADPGIRDSALLLVLFTDTQATAEHDLTVALHKALDRGVRLRWPAVERFPIPERIGNTLCTVALIPATPSEPDA